MNRRITLTLIVASTLLGACDREASPDVVKGQTHAHSGLHGSLSVDAIDKLFARAKKAAVVDVVDEVWRGDVNSFPRVIFRVRVVEAVKGTEVGEVFRFTQPIPGRQPMWVPPEVKIGNRYLMFLDLMDEDAAKGGPASGAYNSFVGQSIYVRLGDQWVRRVEIESGADTPATISDAQLAIGG